MSEEQNSIVGRPNAPHYLDATKRQQALAEIMSRPTVGVKTAACGLGIGQAVAYREAVKLGAIRIGNRFVFPTPKLRETLGLPTHMAA